MSERNSIGELEELVILIVANLQEDAYGVSVKEELFTSANRKLNISSVHTTLDRLEKKGFLTSEVGGVSQERGGRRKRLFKVTAYGLRVLKEQNELRRELYRKASLSNPELGLNYV